MLKDFVIGQRWISEMEPELGLGKLIQIFNRKIKIAFPASDCERLYAIESAPLKRVKFKVGDEVENQSGDSFIITKVREKDGLFVYYGDNIFLPETELRDTISFTTPKERLHNGLFDMPDVFNLRFETHLQRYERSKSPVCGFIGGRIELIPHQFYIANQIVSRYLPRVLLADEIGLGKTIEACLVIHRLLISNRIRRVLILVPESLIHQWFVELLRKFNLLFRIVNEDYCSSIETLNPGLNPFLEDQLAICDMTYLSNSKKRNHQLLEAEWDLVVVDEAHHLTFKSSAYQLVVSLGRISNGMLLLTATPEQLGQRSHFERLCLLDPARYYHFESFVNESTQYGKIASLIEKLIDNNPFSQRDLRQLRSLYKGPLQNKIGSDLHSDQHLRQKIMDHLLDQHGTGRVMFRNTRATITGFPKRFAHLISLTGSEKAIQWANQLLLAELNNNPFDLNELFNDPKVHWLVDFLQGLNTKKVLLICKSKSKAKALHSVLINQIKIKAATFHEEMTIVQRDRNAAWFSEQDGAQLLICSEIGSEGRNFQFAQHLVLFDLPLDPELLEQRIGRLDRIGQKKSVHIHIPFIKNSAQEIVVTWYHEGLQAFERNVPGVYEIYLTFGEQVKDLVRKSCLRLDINKADVKELIHNTRIYSKKIDDHLEKGRDRLLDLNSFKPQQAKKPIQQIKKIDNNRNFEKFMIKLFEFFGVRYEDFADRCYFLNFDALKNNDFPIPPLRDEGLMATFERKKAINREDFEFLNWDHPMVTGAMDLLLGSEQGNSCFAIWPDLSLQAIYIEAVYILECVAPLSLHAGRFLPATPVRIVVDHELEDQTHTISIQQIEQHLVDGQPDLLIDNPSFMKELLPKMLKKSNGLAEQAKSNLIQNGLEEMEETMQTEIHRLKTLQNVNPNVKDEEITLCEDEYRKLKQYISSARLRLDALRLLYRGKTEI